MVVALDIVGGKIAFGGNLACTRFTLNSFRQVYGKALGILTPMFTYFTTSMANGHVPNEETTKIPVYVLGKYKV